MTHEEFERELSEACAKVVDDYGPPMWLYDFTPAELTVLRFAGFNDKMTAFFTERKASPVVEWIDNMQASINVAFGVQKRLLK